MNKVYPKSDLKYFHVFESIFERTFAMTFDIPIFSLKKNGNKK
jgi:hypothetical protein